MTLSRDLSVFLPPRSLTVNIAKSLEDRRVFILYYHILFVVFSTVTSLQQHHSEKISLVMPMDSRAEVPFILISVANFFVVLFLFPWLLCPTPPYPLLSSVTDSTPPNILSNSAFFTHLLFPNSLTFSK